MERILWYAMLHRQIGNHYHNCCANNPVSPYSTVTQCLTDRYLPYYLPSTKVVINVRKSSSKVSVTFIPILLTLNFLNKNLTSGSRGIPYRQENRHTHTHTHDKANGCSPQLFCEHAHKEYI